MNKIKLLLIGVASMGVSSFAYAADETAQTPPCPQQPENQDCPVMYGKQGPESDMLPPPPPTQGSSMMDRNMPGMDNQAFGTGRNGGCQMMRPDFSKLHQGPHFEMPKELKDRLDALQSDREALGDLWVKAVLARGDKPIAAVREEFAKANAAFISKIEKSDKSIKEDMDALRSGFDEHKGAADNRPLKYGEEGEMASSGMQQSCGEAPFDSDRNLIGKIDSDLIAAINARKEPLTLEAFAKMRAAAISKNRQELDKQFGVRPLGMRYGMREGMPMLMPPMDPALAHMRDEMGNMRGGNMQARHELRAQLREAMKIQDQAKREAAIKQILKDMEKNTDAEKAASEAPASK
jgi:hypothetical protein